MEPSHNLDHKSRLTKYKITKTLLYLPDHSIIKLEINTRKIKEATNTGKPNIVLFNEHGSFKKSEWK